MFNRSSKSREKPTANFPSTINESGILVASEISNLGTELDIVDVEEGNHIVYDDNENNDNNRYVANPAATSSTTRSLMSASIDRSRRTNSSNNTNKSTMLTRALGTVVNPVVSCVDVDGVVREIDADALLDRIDINRHLDRVDVNRHLSRIDIDALLDRIDIDELMSKVDINTLIERSDLSSIVARSSSSIFTIMLDTLRTKMVRVDQSIQRVGRCSCCKKDPHLPPKPTERSRNIRLAKFSFDENDYKLAVMVQGRYAGFFARIVTWIIDQIVVAFVVAILMLIINGVADIVISRLNGHDEYSLEYYISTITWLAPFILYIFYLLYVMTFVYLMNATIGLYIFGLRVVKSSSGSKKLNFVQILLWSIPQPIFFIYMIFMIPCVGWVRKDGRQIYDIIAGTGVVYQWDTKMAELRTKQDLSSTIRSTTTTKTTNPSSSKQ